MYTSYDKVGETAHVPGNAKKAMAIMKAMGYTDKQIAMAGDDVHNFQGVGNPHIHASIQPGETVLDVGSGLGIDSFLAGTAAGDTGFVLGIDISNTEVCHARLCARRRRLSQIRFSEADMEQIPLPDQSVDVVISNGAFCLAPDKEKAFQEVYRVLKPGGRISICTTTTRDDSLLEPGVSWPLCMQMFIPMNDIKPMCERIGYVDVMVDNRDSSMSMELPIEVLKTDENRNPNHYEPKRNKVHVGNAEFSHLEEYNMDALCARVCVVAKKPDDAPML
jgi:SAM-dependent methyltransferase